MPSLDHEAVLALLRARPSLIRLLLADEPGVQRGWSGPVELPDTAVSEIQPVDRRADLIIRTAAASFVVEVQRSRDLAKNISWPCYVVLERAAAKGLPTFLLVVAFDRSVEAWARRPIVMGHPGFQLTPLVIGRSSIPVITSEADAIRAPELAVLSALAHGDSDQALAIGQAALVGIDTLDSDRAGLYADIVLQAVDDLARQLLESLVTIPYRFKSDFARKYISIGEEKGREEGREEGQVQSTQDAIRTVLSARGLSLTSAQEQRLSACADVSLLRTWLERAVSAEDAQQVWGA